FYITNGSISDEDIYIYHGHHGLSFDEDGPWQKRRTCQPPSGILSTEIKETVLQNEWFKKPKESVGNVESITDSYEKHHLKPIAEEDHYDFINEDEMEPSPFSNKELKKRDPSRILPAPPEHSDGDEENKLRVPCGSKSETEHFISKEEERSQCLEYSEMVNIFKPLIVQTLNVEDILPSLLFLDNHDDIYEMRNHSPKKSVESLLDELKRSEELGKWQKFLDALSANGYTYIVDNIRGYKFISPEYQREYIRKIKPKIGKMIKTCELLPYVKAKGLIRNTENENIQREFANHGDFAAALELLDIIHKKHRNWYMLFIEALQEANMNDVAVCLQIPALYKNKSSEITDTYSLQPNTDSDLNESIPVIDEEERHNKNKMNPTHFSKKSKSNLAVTTDNTNSKEEERSQCLEYSEMMRIFKPLIVQNLLVDDILPSLSFLENHDDIYAATKHHSPKYAVLSLLDEMERSEELGKWEKFIEALLENGYTYIVDNIRGYKFISHEYQKEYIRKFKPQLRKMINPCELLSHLLAKDVISDSDSENIQQEYANRGNIAAATLLLDRIHRKNRNWYILFIEALQEANMDDVAVCLQIPELLETNRTKATAVCQNDDHYCYYRKDVSEYPHPEKSETCRKHAVEDSQDEIYTNSQFQKDQDDGDVPYFIPPVPKESDLDKIRPKRNLPEEDETITQYEESIPQRVPITEKQKVPLPIWTNDDLEQFINEVSALQSKVEKKDDIKTDKDGKKVLESTSNVESERSKSLQNECEQMQNEYDDLQIQIDRLKQKASINEKMNTALREVRELERVNELKEKERQALKSTDLSTEDYIDVDAENTDTYYPTAAKPKQQVRRETVPPIHDVRIKKMYDFSGPFPVEPCKFSKLPNFNLDSTLSVVQVYSPTFDSRSTIYQMYEQDSGVGIDMALECD
ncbi:uncharacterized protein LOC128554729, partial [Mercenaria mercenaria]|uniref:uncharacterized protein LOC128554729 n=1 Tax=Mercenaria mercenaria TaxID=6596 RepID=UPI00234F303C